jgi:hypothetical protein
MTWWLIFLVSLYLILIFMINEEPPMLTDLKKRYARTLQILRDTGDPVWHPVLKPSIITGIYGKKDGVIGSNVNKGYEIYICLDGDDVNSAMYVLLHELAHMSVPEYDHTTSYWDKFANLKKIAIDNGIYTKKGTRQYCGDTVKD